MSIVRDRPAIASWDGRGSGGALCWICRASAVLVTAGFLWILSDVVSGGWGVLSWDFLTSGPRDAGRAGGINSIIVSTCAIVAVCMACALPVGLGAALYLAEFSPVGGRLAPLVRRSLDVLAGVPSIVFGLFGSAFFCQTLGLGFSILSGGLTLACMSLPLVIRSVEEGFRSVPQEYRLGAAALGMTRTSAVRHIILPAAAPGLVVGMVLGIGRAAAETAALIFTSGYVDRMPGSFMDSGRSLSVHVYDLSMNVPGGSDRAHASALVLVVLVLLINAAAAALAKRWLGSRVIEA